MSAARAVLDARALVLAAPATVVAEDGGDRLAVVTFGPQRERYGIEARWVQEIIRVPPLTPLPGLPEPWIGVMNLRGELLPVIDMRQVVGTDAQTPSGSARVLVLGERRGEIGILADTVYEVAMIRGDGLVAAPGATSDFGGAAVRGVTSAGIVVLDGAALLADPRFVCAPGEDGGCGEQEGRS
jgi:chemotaxis signal transduction protein